MARFALRKTPFGTPPAVDDDGRGLPTPHRLRMQARRAAGIAEAAAILEHLPQPGESLHCLVTARLDLSDILNAIIEKIGTVEHLRIATLGYNRRNFKAMLRWLDAKQVLHLTLVPSIFFRSHNGDLWAETQDEFRSRDQRTACASSHAKVVTILMPSGVKYAIEGSANLCCNGSAREQFAMMHDAGIHDWHSAWIDQLVNSYVGKEEAKTAGH